MLDLARKMQTPALWQALYYSQHIRTTPAQQARAAQLAQTVREILPGIYQVGHCTVDLWRQSCTCKTARLTKLRGLPLRAKPCPHFLALYLAGTWQPIDEDPCAYLRNGGYTAPVLLAVYCRATLPANYPPAPEGFRILETHSAAGYAVLENLATGTHANAPIESLRNLTPYYL